MSFKVSVPSNVTNVRDVWVAWIQQPGTYYTLVIEGDDVYLYVINMEAGNRGDVLVEQLELPPGKYTLTVYAQDDYIDALTTSDVDESTLTEEYVHHFRVQRPGRSATIVKQGHPKYCSCVLQVARHQTQECLKGAQWGGDCYNPYAVCTAKFPRADRKCRYNLEALTDSELIAYASLRKVPTPTGTALSHEERLSLIDELRK